jgi:hypothetical protein
VVGQQAATQERSAALLYHLSGSTASPAFAQSLLNGLEQRLGETGYQVWQTPFGYFCEWELAVYGDSLAKVFKEL